MRVMIVGASLDREKFGNKAVRAYLRQGHEVVPVNPKGGVIEGLVVVRRVEDAVGPFDRVLFYVPPEVGVEVMPRVLGRGDVGEVWLNPGSESDELVAMAERAGVPVIQACAIVDVGERP